MKTKATPRGTKTASVYLRRSLKQKIMPLLGHCITAGLIVTKYQSIGILGATMAKNLRQDS